MTDRERNIPDRLHPPDPPDLPHPPDYSPGLLEPDLRRLDARLTNDAHRLDVPPGLAGRVFDASVGHLPPRRFKLVSTEKTTLWERRQWWGRAAMAAGVMLAFGVSLKLLRESSPLPSPDEIAVITPMIPAFVPTSVEDEEFINTYALSLEAESLLLEFSSEEGKDLSYLVLTRDVTLDDLAGELVMLLAELNEGGM